MDKSALVKVHISSIYLICEYSIQPLELARDFFILVSAFQYTHVGRQKRNIVRGFMYNKEQNAFISLHFFNNFKNA